MRRRSTLFRFENMCLKVEGFKDLLKRWWMGYDFRGAYSFILVVKLKALKSNWKKRNKELFDNFIMRKQMTFNNVLFWDTKERVGVLSQEEVVARRVAREVY